MTSTRLILIRHGQTASNGADPNPRMSGWTDLPLSLTGRQQVEALRQQYPSHPPAAALYSSPLQRARDTAQGLIHASQTPMQVMGDLREIHCGEVDGLRLSEVRQRYPDYWEENLRQENADFRWPGGESYRELRTRSLAAIQAIALAHPAACVLLVTHAGFISQVLGWMHRLSPAKWEAFRPGNTSLTVVEWAAHSQRLVQFDNHSHLIALA